MELQNTLMQHSGVFEAAVIGIADPRWEERPLVIVVARPGESPLATELRSFLADKVARFWLPENWAFVPTLPRTSVGKIDKQALRRQFAQGQLNVVRLQKSD